MTTKSNELVQNTIILGFGKLFYQVIGFILLPLYTTYLSPSQYGQYDLVVSYATLLIPTFTLQLEMAIFRLLIDVRGDVQRQNELIITIITPYVAIAATILVALLAILLVFPIGPQMVTIALFAFTFAIFNVFLQVARGLARNTVFTFANIIASITSLVATIVLVVFMKGGLLSVFLAISIGYTMGLIYMVVKLGIISRMRTGAYNKNILAKAMRYSLPLVPNNVSFWAINMADRTIIAIMLGVALNGIYAVAFKFSAAFQGVLSIVYMSWTESASVHLASDTDRFISKALNEMLFTLASVNMMIILGAATLFDAIIGAEFAGARNYIPVLLIGGLLSGMVSIYGSLYIAKKRTKHLMYATFVVAVFSVSATWILVPHIGLFAPAVSVMTSHLILVAYRHFNLKRTLDITYRKRLLFGVLAAYFIVLFIYYYLDRIYSLIGIIVITIIIVTRFYRPLLLMAKKYRVKGGQRI